MNELKNALLAAAKGDKIIEEKIDELISAGIENLEERLLTLIGSYPVLAVIEPSVRVYLSDIIKSSIPLRMETTGKITIKFQD
jgi:hypothetical protein